MQIVGDGFLSEKGCEASKQLVLPHAEVFAQLDNAIGKLRLFLNKHKVEDQDSDSSRQKIIALVLTARMIEIAEAAKLIMKNGMSNEAKTLLRVFLDAYFVMGNICTDPTFVKEYFKSDLKARLKLMNVSQQQKSNIFASAKTYGGQERADLKDLIDTEGGKAFKSEEYAKNIGCGAIYDSLYRITSSSLHTTPRSLIHYVEEDKDGNVISIFDEPKLGDIPQHAYDFSCFMITVLGGLKDIFGESNQNEIEELREQLNESVNKNS